MHLRLLAAGLALGALAPSAPLAAQLATDTLAIREWEVPYPKSRPRDPSVAPDGRIWFVGQVGNYVGVLDPRTGSFTRFEIPEGALPHTIVVDDKGTPWYAGNGNQTIGRLDPKTGRVTEIRLPDPARDPHTMVFDGRGHLWFTVQGGNVVGRLTVASGEVKIVPVPTERARPYGIVVDKSGRPWFDLFGSHKIGTIDPKTLELEEIALPDPKSRPRRIALTTDGRVWWGDYTRGRLGVYDPKTKQIVEHAMPGGLGSLPYALTVDEHDRLWYVETGPQPNRFVGFDPKTSRFFGATAVPSGGGSVRHMVYDRTTKQIWFGADANTIGRAAVPPARGREST